MYVFFEKYRSINPFLINDEEVEKEMLHTSDGVWACDTHYKCTECCPRSIQITKRIFETKEMIKKLKGVTK